MWISYGLCILLGAAHALACYKEVYDWRDVMAKVGPVGVRDLPTDELEAFAARTQFLGTNQGVYNAFLAAGLILSPFLGGDSAAFFCGFFAACVMVAGIAGHLTGLRLVLIGQGGGGLLTLILVLFGV